MDVQKKISMVVVSGKKLQKIELIYVIHLTLFALKKFSVWIQNTKNMEENDVERLERKAGDGIFDQPRF